MKPALIRRFSAASRSINYTSPDRWYTEWSSVPGATRGGHQSPPAASQPAAYQEPGCRLGFSQRWEWRGKSFPATRSLASRIITSAEANLPPPSLLSGCRVRMLQACRWRWRKKTFHDYREKAAKCWEHKLQQNMRKKRKPVENKPRF